MIKGGCDSLTGTWTSVGSLAGHTEHQLDAIHHQPCCVTDHAGGWLAFGLVKGAYNGAGLGEGQSLRVKTCLSPQCGAERTSMRYSLNRVGTILKTCLQLL